jgi:hypothetical protein
MRAEVIQGRIDSLFASRRLSGSNDRWSRDTERCLPEKWGSKTMPSGAMQSPKESPPRFKITPRTSDVGSIPIARSKLTWH